MVDRRDGRLSPSVSDIFPLKIRFFFSDFIFFIFFIIFVSRTGEDDNYLLTFMLWPMCQHSLVQSRMCEVDHVTAWTMTTSTRRVALRYVSRAQSFLLSWVTLYHLWALV